MIHKKKNNNNNNQEVFLQLLVAAKNTHHDIAKSQVPATASTYNRIPPIYYSYFILHQHTLKSLPEALTLKSDEMSKLRSVWPSFRSCSARGPDSSPNLPLSSCPWNFCYWKICEIM